MVIIYLLQQLYDANREILLFIHSRLSIIMKLYKIIIAVVFPAKQYQSLFSLFLFAASGSFIPFYSLYCNLKDIYFRKYVFPFIFMFARRSKQFQKTMVIIYIL